MRAVNLIPPERRGVRRRSSSRSPLREPLLPLSIAIVAAAVAGVGFAAHSASSTVADRNAQITQLDAQLAKLAAEKQQTSGGSAASQLSVVNDIVQQRASWDGFLGTLSRVVPEDVWLLSLSAQEPTTGTAPTQSASTPTPAAAGTSSVTFTGYTYSQPSVARMMRRLDLVPWLQDVNLVSSTKTAINEHNVYQFTLGATFKPLPQVAT
jgi:Tfp pilus assembly protein PilN